MRLPFIPHLPFIPLSIMVVPSNQALRGFLITAPPSVCVPAVIGAPTVWIQNQENKNYKNRAPSSSFSLFRRSDQHSSFTSTRFPMTFFPLLTPLPVFLPLVPSGAQALSPRARVRLNRLLLYPFLARHTRPLGRIPFPFLPSPLPNFLHLLLIRLQTVLASLPIPSHPLPSLPALLASLHSLLLQLCQVAQCPVSCPFSADIPCHCVSLCSLRSLIFLPPPFLLFPSATGESTWDPEVFTFIIIIFPFWWLSYYKKIICLYTMDYPSCCGKVQQGSWQLQGEKPNSWETVPQYVSTDMNAQKHTCVCGKSFASVYALKTHVVAEGWVGSSHDRSPECWPRLGIAYIITEASHQNPYQSALASHAMRVVNRSSDDEPSTSVEEKSRCVTAAMGSLNRVAPDTCEALLS